MTIKFCKVCDNMYYMKIDGEGDQQKLQYWCRNCGDSEIHDSKQSNCIIEKNYNRGERNYKNFINKYTTEDPTLPRVNNIICPNKECACNRETDPESREVIYIKYDNEELKFLYVCCICKTAWRNSNSGSTKFEILEI